MLGGMDAWWQHAAGWMLSAVFWTAGICAVVCASVEAGLSLQHRNRRRQRRLRRIRSNTAFVSKAHSKGSAVAG